MDFEAVEQYLKITPKHSMEDAILFLAEILENSSQPFASGFPDGSLMYCNKAFCSLTGYTRDELNNLTWTVDLTPAKWREADTYFFRELDKTGKPKRFEKEHIRKDGTIVPIELLVHRACDANSNVVFYHAFITDISERKQMEQELRRFQEDRFAVVFNASPSAMVITDLNGKHIEVNTSFEKITGYNRHEVLGRTIYDLRILERQYLDYMKEVVDKTGSYRNAEVKVKDKSGKIRIFKLSLEKIRFGGEEYILSVFDDITEQKILEKELTRFDCLNVIGQMASGIGHEIRNPMTSVKGFLQLLTNKETDSKKKEYYDLMIEELDRANSIITEFLSLANDRIVELQPASLNVIINTLYPLLNTDAMEQDKRIILNKGDIPNISVNDKEIRQLIINLVRNAIEASLPSGIITISTYISNGEVVLSVEDEGTGIPPEIYDKLGTPFVTTKDTGTGLGVSICYSIARKHNAKIDVKTGPSGTTFYVKFKMPIAQ